jgi:hypothetical protein
MARPAPDIARRAADTGTARDQTNDIRVSDAADSTHSKRTFAQAVTSLIGAGGLAPLLPVLILAVGTPVALGVRGLVEAAEWLLTIIH